MKTRAEPIGIEVVVGAIDAFDAIAAGSATDAQTLVTLMDAAKSTRVPLYENATNLLGRLVGPRSEYEFEKYIRKLWSGRKGMTGDPFRPPWNM